MLMDVSFLLLSSFLYFLCFFSFSHFFFCFDAVALQIFLPRKIILCSWPYLLIGKILCFVEVVSGSCNLMLIAARSCKM